jgi:ATPase subunit of ABC transporter with duplicated ATPase domains
LFLYSFVVVFLSCFLLCLGVGKTALFNAMVTGEIKEFPAHLHVHHMQELDHHPVADEISVIQTILDSHPFRRMLVVIEEILKTKIAAEEEGLSDLKTNLKYVEMLMRSISGYNAEYRVQKMLRVLGFDEIGEQRPLSALSGGLRMRVALCSAFFIDPELLLLDEPTNHLDFPSVLWLENRLRGYKGSFVVVTHDRQLLENVCTSVLLLQDQKIEYFNCSFKMFEQKKKALDEKKDKDIDKFLERNRNVDPSSMLARTKMRYQQWQRKHYERQVMLAGKFTFKAPKTLPNPLGLPDQKDISLIKMEDVRFSYNPEGGHFIFNQPISFDCKLGTRVGVMGPNGAGKSTFLKLLTGKLTATEGKIITNPDYTLAYFGQHSTKELKMEETPIEFMQKSFPKDREGLLLNHLEKTSVSKSVANTRMESLSYSQRSCVIFAKLTYVPPHLLIMDEPTNFLDLDSVDSLIAATNKFTGALLVVTHSRDFLKRCASQFLSIVPGQFLTFDSMKKAERATYTFIQEMESGEKIDLKKAIMQNPGGGSVHHSQVGDGEKKMEKVDLSSICISDYKEKAGKSDNKKALQKAADEEKARALAEYKAKKKAAKKAAIKRDWVVGDVCWAPYQGKFYEAEVVRVVPFGITIEYKGYGETKMLDAAKLKQENPTPAPKKRAPKKDGAKGGAKGAKGKGKGGQRGGQRRGQGQRQGQGQRSGGQRGGQRNQN